MRRSFCWIAAVFFLAFTAAMQAGETRIIKVLPHFIDLKGRHTVSPSLYERDAYQAQLRQHPKQRSGIRFDVQTRGKGVSKTTRIRLELRGAKGEKEKTHTLEQPLGKSGLFSTWTSLPFTGEEYKNFGEVVAWRATLWDGDRKIDEQKSFLW